MQSGVCLTVLAEELSAEVATLPRSRMGGLEEL